jgi:hypothetical protein
MKWPLTECRVVGAMRPVEGKAPFARGSAVLERTDAPGRLLQVHGYTLAEAEGDELDGDAWETLLASQQATSLKAPPQATAHAALWILRPGFSARNQLLADLSREGALLEDETAPGGVRCAVVREDHGNPIRDRYALEHFEVAWGDARAGRWTDALRGADLAFVLSRGIIVERAALLSLALERMGRKAAADAMIAMTTGSRGADFGQSVRAARDDFARQCAAYATVPGPGRTGWRAEMHQARTRALKDAA